MASRPTATVTFGIGWAKRGSFIITENTKRTKADKFYSNFNKEKFPFAINLKQLFVHEGNTRQSLRTNEIFHFSLDPVHLIKSL